MTTAHKLPTIIGRREFAWGRRTYVMAVLNVTPDSFSGDGTRGDVDTAVEKALEFERDGADIIDVGGESTRPPSVYPGSQPVSVDEEKARVVPVIRRLAASLNIPISVDTYKSSVAAAAIEAGASMINDVCGLTRDPDMVGVVAESGAPVVLMHNQSHTRYRDVVNDVVARLGEIRDAAVSAGVSPDRIILDPGIGFGKTIHHNLEILRRLDEFSVLSSPLLVGASRKSTIGRVLDLPVDDRVEGTAATVAVSIVGGADVVRVHDVKQMARVAKMTDAIVRGWADPA